MTHAFNTFWGIIFSMLLFQATLVNQLYSVVPSFQPFKLNRCIFKFCMGIVQTPMNRKNTWLCFKDIFLFSIDQILTIEITSKWQLLNLSGMENSQQDPQSFGKLCTKTVTLVRTTSNSWSSDLTGKCQFKKKDNFQLCTWIPLFWALR